jgi:hypothetical protein
MKELIIHKSYKCKMYEYYKCKSKNMLFLYCEEKIDRIFTIHCTIFNDDAEFEEYLKNSTDQLASFTSLLEVRFTRSRNEVSCLKLFSLFIFEHRRIQKIRILWNMDTSHIWTYSL